MGADDGVGRWTSGCFVNGDDTAREGDLGRADVGRADLGRAREQGVCPLGRSRFCVVFLGLTAIRSSAIFPLVIPGLGRGLDTLWQV